MSDPKIPRCAPEYCAQVQPQINQTCKREGWPPGYQILMVKPDGETCYCTCGGGGSGKPAGRKTRGAAAP